MIDGVKIPIRGRDQQRLRIHHLLNWTAKGPGRDGSPRYVARYGNAFTFHGDETRCTRMVGSFHKQHHGGTNWQDFTFTNFIEAVTSVCIPLGLHSANLGLSNLEVGANIIPPIETANVLRSIVLHKTTAPAPMHEGQGIVIRHAAYRFKIYDKALQYARPGKLLRFEIAANKMRLLERYGVRTFADLLEPSTWVALQGYLLARFNELLIMEPGIHRERLRPAEVELLRNAGNPTYWAGLDKRRRSEKRKTLNSIYMRHAPHGLKATLRILIATKLEELNNAPTPDLCTDGVPTNTTTAPRTFAPQVPTQNDHPKKGLVRTFAPHALRGAKVRVEVPKEEGADVQRCLTCGRDISEQCSTSKFCSEQRYGRVGKSCRNAASNWTRDRKRIEQRGILLFDHTPYLRPLGPRHYRIKTEQP